MFEVLLNLPFLWFFWAYRSWAWSDQNILTIFYLKLLFYYLSWFCFS